MRLDVYLYEQKLASSRSSAANMIKLGQVQVNSKICTKTSWQVSGDDEIKLIDTTHYVSRSAQKLLTVYEAPELAPLLSPEGKICLDIGASTGGFIQVLLERGAKQVFALDVGHSQLSDVVKNDSRVVQIEGTNIRDVRSPADIECAPEGGFDIIVCDISFISVTFALPAIYATLKKDAVAAVLIKPQFELGKSMVKKASGVIKSQRLLDEAVKKVVDKASETGFEILKVLPSKITGQNGNQEFIAVMRTFCYN